MALRPKHLGALLGLLLLFPFAHAEEVQDIVIGPFGNLNNTDNPLTIPADRAQDLLNVDISPGGKSVLKRDGYAVSATLSISSSPVHGTYSFYDSNGNDVALFFNDTYMTSSISGASATVLFSNGSNGATYQCVDAEGYAYCSNTARTGIIKTNGQTYSLLTVVTTGTIVANTPKRLVQSGFSGFPNRIDFSKANDFTTWTVGGQPTDPIQFTITAPGARITHLTYAFNRIMWFKNTSFGYILEGPTLADWTVNTISPNLGTLDNTSVYWNGILYFRGQDGHLYQYDGSAIAKLTRDIGGTISVAQSRTQNSWTQSTQADWNSGNFSFTNYADTITSSGDLRLTFPDYFSTFRDGSNGSKKVWNTSCVGGNCSTATTVSNGFMVMISTDGKDQVVRSNFPTTNYKQGTTFYVLLSSMVPAVSNNVFEIAISSQGKDGNWALNNDYFYLSFQSTNTGFISLNFLKNTNDLAICVGNSNCDPGRSYSIPASINFWISTTTYQIKVNGIVCKSGTHSYTNNQSYVYLDAFSGSVSPATFYIDTFGVAPETFTFLSAVKNASNLTAWDSFTTSQLDNGGTQSFFIRSSTNSITVTSSTPSWTSISVGAVPSISIGTYFQIRDDFLITNATQNPILQDFTQNWFEGSASDKSYATYFSDAIWWSLASGAGATGNNTIIRHDLINGGQTLYDIPIGGFYLRNQNLYFGSAVAGLIHKFGGVDNDNGAAINAYWKSKDFFTANPFIENDFRNLSVSAGSVQNSSTTVTYTVNGSSSSSLTMPLYTSGSSFTKKNVNLPLGTNGSEINVKVGNNAADQDFEIFGIKVGFVPKSWVPK